MSRFRDFLSDTLLVLGVGTVLLSIIQPFSILSYVGTTLRPFLPPMPAIPLPPLQADFFTFKVTWYIPGEVYSRSELWNAYWFNNGDWRQLSAVPSVPYFLITTFAIQILTLVLGITALSLKPRVRIVPFVSCLCITVLLTWVYSSFRGRDLYYSLSLGSGYWLSCASVLCLFASTILARGRQTRIMFEGLAATLKES